MASTLDEAVSSGPSPLDPAEALQAGLALHRAGRIDEAAALYRQVLEAAPDHPRALHLLGVSETERGHVERGIELLQQAIPCLDATPEPHFDLGNALRIAGKREEALENYRRALARNPNYALAHACIASLLTELGRYEAAISHCQTAIAIEAESIPARIVLAVALKEARRLPEAAETWRAIIELEPERPDSYAQLASQLASLGLFKEAVHCYDRAIALQPDNVSFHCMRGGALIRLYDGAAAEASFRQALKLSPHSKEAWGGLSWTLRLLGRFEEADRCLERLREIDPTDLRDVRHIPATGKQQQDVAELDRLAAAFDNPANKSEDRIAAAFALGRLLDEAGRFDEAFAHYAEANRLMRENWRADGDRYDPVSFGCRVDALIATNTQEAIADGARAGNMSELPVFVVGMPRSGTTLVEQICASHARIHAAGELDAIPLIAWEMLRGRQTGPRLFETARRVADRHIVRLHRLGRGALRVVDKLPDNVLLVGVIARLFPRARIVYCSRDPRDTALSCYFQVFVQGAQYFSYDLADCGRRCRDVQRLAEHWQKLLPLHMIEVNYEKLVADLEGESRRLIDFLGLDWEPACLEFYRTERTVATVSHWQVRQPIYSSSVGRWRHYEKHLGPLFAALDEPAAPQAMSPDTPSSSA